jgi:hypothetical protein
MCSLFLTQFDGTQTYSDVYVLIQCFNQYVVLLFLLLYLMLLLIAPFVSWMYDINTNISTWIGGQPVQTPVGSYTISKGMSGGLLQGTGISGRSSNWLDPSGGLWSVCALRDMRVICWSCVANVLGDVAVPVGGEWEPSILEAVSAMVRC